MPSKKVKIHLLLLFFISLTALSAKSPVSTGDFYVLKTATQFSVNFNYDQTKIDTFSTQEDFYDYSAATMDSVNTPLDYKKAWTDGNRAAEIYFLGTFNQKTKTQLTALDGGKAVYQVEVQILSIDPGYYSVTGGTGAEISAKLLVLEGKEKIELASLYVPRAKGKTYFSQSERKSSAYARLAKIFNTVLNKELK